MDLKRHVFNVGKVVMISFFIFSCEPFPKDTFNTTQQVKNGKMLVGYSQNWPWVFSSESGMGGIEVEIVKQFAQTLNTEIVWVEQDQESLLKQLEHHNLHLVISGLTSKTPWKKNITLTSPYLDYERQKHVLAVPPGEHRFLYELQLFLIKNNKHIKKLLSQYSEKEPVP